MNTFKAERILMLEIQQLCPCVDLAESTNYCLSHSTTELNYSTEHVLICIMVGGVR
jgi:hypothetical protein